MNDHLTFNGHTFDKFHIIEHADSLAGFCALITYALNGVRLARKNNWLPVVKYDNNDVHDYFYDPVYGKNVWDYYFEPVMGIDYPYLKNLLDEGKIPSALIHTYHPEQIKKWHHEDPNRIATFWAFEEPENPASWMAEKRKLGREYVASYIKVKPHILNKVEQFYTNHIKPQYTLGVHIRGTDFHYAEPTKPEVYFQEIHKRATDDKRNNFKIFLATDQMQFVDMFRQEFGERVISYESIRSSSDVPAFLFQDVSPYRKGEDVLIDVLLLSKCNYLFKGAAAVGEYALWFNPSLECTDFALKSHYKRENVVSAYLELNIDQLPKVQWRLLTLQRKAKFAMLDAALVIGRYLLPSSLRDWLWQTIGRNQYIPKNKTSQSGKKS